MAQTRSGVETDDSYEMDDILYAREAEIKSYKDLEKQRGTAIPALFNQVYKFIQNPSSVSVETYKRMVDTDDTIGAGVDFLTTCLAARLGAYQHPNDEITAWMNKRLNEIQGGWFNKVKEILSATWTGFSVGEKVWDNTPNGFVIKKIVTLPPTTVLFETDRTGELTPDGILQYQRNYNPSMMSQGIGYYGGTAGGGFGFQNSAFQPDAFARFGDMPFPLRTANTFNYLSVRIPTMKCVHYAFDAQGKFGNPYGRSLLRRCYKYYVTKDAILKMMITALDRKGTPLTVVYADPNTTLLDPSKKAAGNNKAKYVGMRADEAARQAFDNLHNDTTIVLPGKKGSIFDTDFVPQDSNTESFLGALDFCNKSIMRALLIPSLIFTNGDGTGSFALGQEHAKTFEKILDGMLEGLKQVLHEQVIKELLAYNFPRSMWEKEGLGEFSKRQFSQDEVQKIMEMYEKGIQNGVIDTNDLADLNLMRDTLGFDPKTELIEKPLDAFGDGDGTDGEDGQDDGRSEQGHKDGGREGDGSGKGAGSKTKDAGANERKPK